MTESNGATMLSEDEIHELHVQLHSAYRKALASHETNSDDSPSIDDDPVEHDVAIALRRLRDHEFRYGLSPLE